MWSRSKESQAGRIVTALKHLDGLDGRGIARWRGRVDLVSASQTRDDSGEWAIKTGETQATGHCIAQVTVGAVLFTAVWCLNEAFLSLIW